MDKKGMLNGLIGTIVGIAVGAIVTIVCIAIYNSVYNTQGASFNGTTKSVAGYIPVFLILGVLVVAALWYSGRS